MSSPIYNQHQTSPGQHPQKYSLIPNSPQPVLSKSSQKYPNERWAILIVACLSTFGAALTEKVLNNSLHDLNRLWGLTPWELFRNTQIMELFTNLVPIIAGLVISRIGITRLLTILILLLVSSRILVAVGVHSVNWGLYLAGTVLFKIANSGLSLAQMYMNIKWFKGKELSLAIGIAAWSRLIPWAISFSLSEQVHENLIQSRSILYLGVPICLLSAIGIPILSKLEASRKEEEERAGIEGGAEEEYNQTSRRVIRALGLAVVCFFIVDHSSNSSWARIAVDKISMTSVYVITQLIMFPLAGFLTDFMRKRIPIVLVGTVISFSGVILLNLAGHSSSNLFLYIVSFLLTAGSCVFQVSVWACIGVVTPFRILGPVLGLVFSGMGYASLLLNGSLSVFLAFFTAIGLVIFAWKLDYSKNNSSDGGRTPNIENDKIQIN